MDGSRVVPSRRSQAAAASRSHEVPMAMKIKVHMTLEAAPLVGRGLSLGVWLVIDGQKRHRILDTEDLPADQLADYWVDLTQGKIDIEPLAVAAIEDYRAGDLNYP